MKITFVVPTRNNARTLAPCLTSLRAQTHVDCEVVVVDNFSADATPAIARSLADVVEEAGPERCAQRNRGAAVGTGEVVVFVDSDMVLEPEVAAEVAAVLDADPALGALVLPERSFGEGFLARCRGLEKSLYVGDARTEAPRAFRREVLERVGGWDETLNAAEDWELADRLRAHGVAIGRVEAWTWHDEGRIRLRETFTKKRYYGRWVGEYLARDRAATTTHLGRTALLSSPGRLARQPVLTAGMVVLKGVEAAGLVAGMRDERRSPARTGTR